MEKGKWVKVGEIGVDAGLCWIGDPCYILHKSEQEKPKAIGKDWSEFCNILDKHREENDYPTMIQFNYDMGHPGLGVAVSTGWGDGSYDVMARVYKGRVCEVKVLFMGANDEEDLGANDEEDE
jgi:hypothetical protein